MKHLGIIIAIAAVAVIGIVGYFERDNLRREMREHKGDLNNVSERVIHLAMRGEKAALEEAKTLIARHRHSDPHGERGADGAKGPAA